jgi:four helix bundle protein
MKEEIKRRSKKLALSIISMSESLPRSMAGKHIANQLIRSATSVAANYRAVCRARSDNEFVAKLQIVIEEADETLFWLEIIGEQKWIDEKDISLFHDEMNQLLSIFISSAETIKNRIIRGLD